MHQENLETQRIRTLNSSPSQMLTALVTSYGTAWQVDTWTDTNGEEAEEELEEINLAFTDLAGVSSSESDDDAAADVPAADDWDSDSDDGSKTDDHLEDAPVPPRRVRLIVRHVSDSTVDQQKLFPRTPDLDGESVAPRVAPNEDIMDIAPTPGTTPSSSVTTAHVTNTSQATPSAPTGIDMVNAASQSPEPTSLSKSRRRRPRTEREFVCDCGNPVTEDQKNPETSVQCAYDGCETRWVSCI